MPPVIAVFSGRDKFYEHQSGGKTLSTISSNNSVTNCTAFGARAKAPELGSREISPRFSKVTVSKTRHVVAAQLFFRFPVFVDQELVLYAGVDADGRRLKKKLFRSERAFFGS